MVIPALVGPGAPGIGGTAANVSALVNGLRRRGHEVLVLGYGPPEAAVAGFLPVVHRAIEAHRGDVTVDSDEHGTRITVRLPRLQTAAVPRPGAAA